MIHWLTLKTTVAVIYCSCTCLWKVLEQAAGLNTVLQLLGCRSREIWPYVLNRNLWEYYYSRNGFFLSFKWNSSSGNFIIYNAKTVTHFTFRPELADLSLHQIMSLGQHLNLTSKWVQQSMAKNRGEMGALKVQIQALCWDKRHTIFKEKWVPEHHWRSECQRFQAKAHKLCWPMVLH